RARSVQAQSRHEDEAGRREDVGRGRRARTPAEQSQDDSGRDGRLHDQRAVARHGHLRARMERQEEGRRLAVEHLGPDGRHAARPLADGIADLRERSRRAEARRGPVRRHLARRRSDEEAERQGHRGREHRPNQDSKVFEVKIDVVQADTTLRPGMTTSNAIEISSVPNVLSVPLDAVVSDGGFSYVYKKDGRNVVKQMIETGAMNDNEIVVKKGLTKDDRVLLTVPTDKTGIKTVAIPGLKPAVSASQGDTAKSVTLPAKPTTPATPVPAATPAAKPKG